MNELYRTDSVRGGSAQGEGRWVLYWANATEGPERYRFRTKKAALAFARIFKIELAPA